MIKDTMIGTRPARLDPWIGVACGSDPRQGGQPVDHAGR